MDSEDKIFMDEEDRKEFKAQLRESIEQWLLETEEDETVEPVEQI